MDEQTQPVDTQDQQAEVDFPSPIREPVDWNDDDLDARMMRAWMQGVNESELVTSNPKAPNNK